MTVEPAPDRQAPIAPASRADWIEPRELREGLGPVLLVEPIDGEDAEQVEPPDRHPRDADRQAGQVRDRVLARDLGRQHGPHLGGREAQVRDEQDRPKIARRIEAERLDRAVDRGADDEPAVERGRRVVGMALDLVRQAQQVGARQRLAEERVAGDEPGDRRRRRRSEPARERESRCASRSASRRPRASRRGPREARPRSPGRSGSRGPGSARPRPRPGPRARSRRGSSRGPRPRPGSSARARRPGSRSPRPRFALDAGTSTVTRRPSSSASQFVTIRGPPRQSRPSVRPR